MISKRFGRKPKGKDNAGRATEVTSVMISKTLKNRLAELKGAYEGCYGQSVSYDQMLRRWADNAGRIDPKVVVFLDEMRESRRIYIRRQAECPGVTARQTEANEAHEGDNH